MREPIIIEVSLRFLVAVFLLVVLGAREMVSWLADLWARRREHISIGRAVVIEGEQYVNVIFRKPGVERPTVTEPKGEESQNALSRADGDKSSGRGARDRLRSRAFL
jgi:hypothetical protein